MKNKKDHVFFFLNGQNLLLQNWKFSKKNVFRYVKNSFSCHISFQIGMRKRIFVKNVHIESARPLEPP